LREVISNNLTHLDADLAGAEIVAHVSKHLTQKHRHILLECTNLPPYKAALTQQTGLPVTDILTLIEFERAGTIHSDFL